jgi:hypothetical protein
MGVETAAAFGALKIVPRGETERRGRIGGSNGRHILRSLAVCEDRRGCSAVPDARDAQRTGRDSAARALPTTKPKAGLKKHNKVK